MGNADVQGDLWSQRAADWAELQEHFTVPLLEASLNAAFVTRGTRLLDAGCGAGIAAVLATLRGALVTAVDAAPGLLEIARRRLPDAAVLEADLEALPFGDGEFDAVVAVNAVFFAADPEAAARELVRTVRSGGRVVLGNWGPAGANDWRHVQAGLGSVLPPPPAGARNWGADLGEPGALEALLEACGLTPVDREEVSCPFTFANPETAWVAIRSVGPLAGAIDAVGEARVHGALRPVFEAHRRSDGSVRLNNSFLVVAAEKP